VLARLGVIRLTCTFGYTSAVALASAKACLKGTRMSTLPASDRSSLGRVALVTGAASGIGASVARSLRASGHSVAGFDLAASVTDLSCIGDVTDAEAVSDAVTRITGELGAIDTVVSVAGYYEMIPFSKITEAQWTRMLRVHLGGLTNIVRATLPDMLDRRQGTIVAVSSEMAIGGGDGDAHYAAAKGAIIGFVRSLAVEVASQGIRVNSVAPGACDTSLLAADSPWREHDYLDTLPARRLARPDEVATAVQFLVDDGSFMVGEVISVNGGEVI
jgi:2-hydroxycyclohexanecarboxyl-CoA dehydrogenase